MGSIGTGGYICRALFAFVEDFVHGIDRSSRCHHKPAIPRSARRCCKTPRTTDAFAHRAAATGMSPLPCIAWRSAPKHAAWT
jgi:hypothetical protein